MSSTPKSKKSSQPQDEKRKPYWTRQYRTTSGVIEIALWESTIGEGDKQRDVVNATFRKTYKRAEDDYPESKSYRQEDLPTLIAALQEAFLEMSAFQDRE